MINSAIPSHAAVSPACSPRERGLGLHLLLQTSNPLSSDGTTIPAPTTESIVQNDAATLTVEEVNENQDHPNDHARQQHSSSMVRHLSQSLVAFSEAGRIIDIVGRRAIQLGVEDVRSRIDSTSEWIKPTRHRQRGRECNNDHIEAPPAKRRCTTSNQERAGNNGTENENTGKSISPEDMADAQRIHRMATLIAQMREIQAMFVDELETFASRVEGRKALEQDQKMLPALGLAQESSPRVE